MARLEGWEQRLDALIEAARDRPYVLGEHDCFRVACAVIEALTGVDRWPEWAGRYSTKREALVLLAQYGSSFEAAGDRFFDSPRMDWKLARRGDIVALATPDGEKHLGVVLDHRAAFLGVGGLSWFPASAALCAWRIG